MEPNKVKFVSMQVLQADGSDEQNVWLTVFILCTGERRGIPDCIKSFESHTSQQVALHYPFTESSIVVHKILENSLSLLPGGECSCML